MFDEQKVIYTTCNKSNTQYFSHSCLQFTLSTVLLRERNFVLILQFSVISTPAEEGSGGKIVLIKKGVFDDVDVAMTSHPAPNDLLKVELTATY